MSLQTFFDNFALLADARNGVLELREIILQLAVQGKLLSHNKNDLSAFQLAKEIKAARMRVNKTGKGTANDSLFPVEFKKPPFEISPNWCWISIGEVMNLINGRAFKPSDWGSTGIPIVRIQNLNNPDAPFNYCPFDVDEKFFINDSDLLISWSGTPGTSFGAFIWDRGRAVLNQHIFRAELYGEGYDKPFLRLAINARLDEMIAQAHGAVGLQHITKGKLENLLIPLPPLEEQKRIVAKVDELMRLCDELEARQQARRESRVRLNNALLAPLNNAASLTPQEFEQASVRLADNFAALYDSAKTVGKLRSTILQLAVQGKLVLQNPNDEPASALLEKITRTKTRLSKEKKIRQPELILSDEEIEAPFQLPDGWLWARFGDVTINRDGERIPVEKSIRQGRQGVYNYYGASGVIDKIDDYLFDKPLLLIGEDGANLINRATPIAFIAKGKYWVNNHAHVLDSLSLACLEYLEVFINAIDLRPYITGTAQPKMNQAKMNSILVALAPEEEQKRIVAKVNQLMALCDELETKLRQTEADSEKLMKAAVRYLLDTLAGQEKSQRENALALSSN